MHLLRVELSRFRNLAPVDLEPGPGLNVILGANGQGKTNLLEALYYLATLRSFRSAQARELVQWGESAFRLRGLLSRQDRTVTYEVVGSTEGRTLKVDGAGVDRPDDYFGAWSVVLFTPEHLGLVRSEPALRRTFLDRACFNVEPGHLDTVRRYQRVLRSRNVLLKQAERGRPPAPELLDAFDQQLADTGARLVNARRRCLAELGPRVTEVHERLGSGSKRLEVSYRAKGLQGAEPDGPGLLAALAGRRAEDLRRGFTGVGPHQDDLRLTLAGRPARAAASQGEVRTIVLALKLAELAWIVERRGETPVLLLDDMSSELDETRRARLFADVEAAGCQTFITTVSLATLPPGLLARTFGLAAGVLDKRLSDPGSGTPG
jgi:DNA replication and repair protein RecF